MVIVSREHSAIFKIRNDSTVAGPPEKRAGDSSIGVKMEDGSINGEHTNFAQMIFDRLRGNTSGEEEIRARFHPEGLHRTTEVKAKGFANQAWGRRGVPIGLSNPQINRRHKREAERPNNGTAVV
jgi:hypothetical protein